MSLNMKKKSHCFYKKKLMITFAVFAVQWVRMEEFSKHINFTVNWVRMEKI